MNAVRPIFRMLGTLSLLSVSMACAPSAPPPATSSAVSALPNFASARIPPPEGASQGGCWVRDVAPAEIKTITRQVEMAPARAATDSSVGAPAQFQTETEQTIATERQELTFEVPCPELVTADLIETLQRALQARNLYQGPITGVMDAATARAVRRYQSARGLQSDLLSIQSARALGLLATPRDQL